MSSMFANFLPVLVAMDAAAPKNGPAHASGMEDFPDEEPTDKALGDWLDSVSPSIKVTFGAVLRGDTPGHLKHLQGGADDLTGFTVLPAGTANMRPDQIMAHNRKV